MNISRIHSIPLYDIDGLAVGPIQSLCHDEVENIYFTDEINHRVISMDMKGNVRWIKGQKGYKQSQFCYPSAITCGYIGSIGAVQRCVAVCDAWNHRIQLFDPDGKWLSEWTHAGNRPLGEVVDIKYLTKGSTENIQQRQGQWLILDRTNHAIYSFGTAGELESACGRSLPGTLEPQWVKTTVERLATMPGASRIDNFVFDPLYYPSRFFGNSRETLLVWEPLARKLKQLICGCLFTLSLKLDSDADCIAASEDHFVLWIPSESCLLIKNYSDENIAKVFCNSRPILSDLKLNQIWVQYENSISQIQLSIYPRPSTIPVPGTQLFFNAESEIHSLLNVEETMKKADAFINSSTDIRNFCRHIWQMAERETFDCQALTSLESKLTSATNAFLLRAADIGKFLNDNPLLCLKINYLQSLGYGTDANSALLKANRLSSVLAASFEHEFLALQQMLDFFSVERPNLISKTLHLHTNLSHALDQVEIMLMSCMRELEYTYRSIRISFESQISEEICHAATQGPAVLSASRLPRNPFFESDRINLSSFVKDCALSPYGLASGSNGHVFVVLRSAKCIIELDRDYRFVRQLGSSQQSDPPDSRCIAIDSMNRLWLAEYLKNSIRYCLLDSEDSRFIPVDLHCNTPIRMPFALCAWRNRQVLLTDTQNNRILSISADGRTDIVVTGKGTGNGEFMHPVAVIPDTPADGASFWVVDHRNHRVQKFDALGRYVLSAGKPGFGTGTLILPIAGAVFPDGSLVVAQQLVTRCLVLFAPDGEELGRTYLDFNPGGILVHGNVLLVTDINGDCIRVFKRN